MTAANTNSPAVDICCCLGPILLFGLVALIAPVWWYIYLKKISNRRNAMAQFASQAGLKTDFSFFKYFIGREGYLSGVYRGRNLEMWYRKGHGMLPFSFYARVPVSDPDFRMMVWQAKLQNSLMGMLKGKVIGGIRLGARKEGVEYGMATSDEPRANQILSSNAGWKVDELLSGIGLWDLNLEKGSLLAERSELLKTGMLEFDAPSLRKIADGLCDIAEAVEKSGPSPAPETAPADGSGYSTTPETSF